jgi:hypothetical protein
MKAKKVFISYSHKDEFYREELEKHLISLKRNGLVETWTDRKILPGEEWENQIHSELENADIILLLVSSDFLASNYCYEVEGQKALAQHEAGLSIVVPLILRHCDWKDTPFGKFQGLPTDAKPVKEFADLDNAFLSIVTQLKKIIEKERINKNESVKIKITNLDIQTITADVFVLDYYGKNDKTDQQVFKIVPSNSFSTLSAAFPNSKSYKFFETSQFKNIKRAIVIDNSQKQDFYYNEIKEYSNFVLQALEKEYSDVESIALILKTYRKLDELEAFISYLVGFQNALQNSQTPCLNEITFLIKERDYYERLKAYFSDWSDIFDFSVHSPNTLTVSRIKEKASFKNQDTSKPIITVFIHQEVELNDIYYFGIQYAAHENGFLCERAEISNQLLTDIDESITSIERADIIIFVANEISEGMLLNLGYALGKFKKIITLQNTTNNTATLHDKFNPIKYSRVIDLKNMLAKELKLIKSKI